MSSPRVGALFLLLLMSLPCQAQEIGYQQLVGRLTDLRRLSSPIVSGEKTAASTSHDRASRYDADADRYHHWSANNDGSGSIRREGDGVVMVDLTGPGVLWRIWSALPEQGHIRIYLDGQATPVIDQPFREYFDQLERDYPGLALTLSRGRNAFVPISFARSCRVVLQDGWGAYFHCTHTQFAAGTRVEPFSGFTPEVRKELQRASDALRHPGRNPWPDSGVPLVHTLVTIPPGESRVVQREGSGAIQSLRISLPNLPTDPLVQEDILRELTLALAWDGETKPSVWAPLGDFFATSPGLNSFATRVMGCQEGTFYSYLEMPFEKGMELRLHNDGSGSRDVEVELQLAPLAPEEAAHRLRFCAAWHSDDFTGVDRRRFLYKTGDRWPDWPLLVVEGRGRFVGMTQHIWKYGGWWGEGDEKFFVDGERFPSTIGTGSEDYIGYAWAAEPPFVTFNSPFAALSRLRPDAQQDTSVCRFHLCDDLPFQSRFEAFLEVMPNPDCRPALYDTCVYWYREAGAHNPYPIIPLAGRRHRRPGPTERQVRPATFPRPEPQPGLVEGESLRVLRVSGGRHWTQEMTHYADDTWSDDTQLIWTDARLGDEIELEFGIPEAGRYELRGTFSKASDYGVFELLIDGQTIDRLFDFYDTRVCTTGELPLGQWTLAGGAHVLKARAVGQNPKIKAGPTGGHIFGLDTLRWKRLP